MSTWTHIVAAVDVDTHTRETDIQNLVEDMLKEAPKITGSEGNANVFVNVLSGYNSFTNMDCEHCEYKDTITHDNDGFCCECPETYICQSGKFQTRVVITVVGDLRDRCLDESKKEWRVFYKYISKKIGEHKGFEIRNIACNIKY